MPRRSQLPIGVTLARPTIRDVARAAGVSTATVSNAFTGRRQVGPELAARVREAADGLNWRATAPAAQLRTGRTRMIVVMVPDLANPFFTTLIAVIEGRAREAGYDLIAASSAEDPLVETKRLAALGTWRPAGIVVVPATDRFSGDVDLMRHGTPVVLLDRVTGEPAADTVTIEDEGAAADAVRHLLDRGRRRLLLLGSTRSIANMRARIAGAERAIQEAGCGASAEVIEAGFSAPEAAAALRRHLARGERADAVFALTNLATLGALQALRDANLAVPRDVALLGFDDEAWMPMADPPVTSVRQPVEALATEAWRMLAARIAGDPSSPCRIRLGCSLVVRASTGPAPPVRPKTARHAAAPSTPLIPA